jgi:23S rRNA (pseudouridine1915-N3)-methyltransferase
MGGIAVNIYLIVVGKLKESYWRDAMAEYVKRLGRFCHLEVVEIAESKNTSRAPKDIAKACQEEGERILAALRGRVVVLDLAGKEVTSEDIAAYTREAKDKGETLSFVIGGSDGLSPEVKARADLTIRFGRITLPHQLCRVLLTEQLYRAFCINAGILYHK